MRKPVISSEISSKFDGVPTTDTLPTPNYQILLIYDIYNLNISRFQLSDILVFIAGIKGLDKDANQPRGFLRRLN